MSKKALFFTDFPENNLGLKRGTILEANRNIPEYKLKKGEQLPIGFDGKDICCSSINWTVEQIENEIISGMWTITERCIDLRDYENAKSFIEKVEQRSGLIQ